MNNPIPDLNSRIIFDSDTLLVINKPDNIPTSGRDINDKDSLQYWLIEHFDQMIWAIHQIDADTTGLNFFVKQKELVQLIHEKLGDKKTTKEYLAIVHRTPNWENGVWVEKSHIGYVDDRSLGIVNTGGKLAHSEFVVLDSSKNYSLILAKIYTGRTHQIRIHLSHLGYPLVGDEWYGDGPCTLHHRQALHAWKTTIPMLEPECFIARPADDFIQLANKLGLKLQNDQ